MKTLVKLFVLALLVLLGWFGWKASQVLPMGTGYIAKTVCSEYFLAGRDDLDRIWSDIKDIDPLFGWGQYDLDVENGRATGYFGLPLLKTTAVYREGLGCSIAANIDAAELRPLPPALSAELPHAEPFPVSAPRPALETSLDEAFREPSADSHRQTRAIVVLHRGRIVAERYAPGFSPDTPLIGWSMTKSITNTLVGMLVKDGLLQTDQPAPVAEWSEENDPRGRITLVQLLQMSSGLDFSEVYKPGSDATNMLFAEHSAAAYAAAAPLGHDPGTRWSYSSGTSNILARIVSEAVGGTSEATYRFIRTRLFEPLGITTLVLEPDASGVPVGSSFSYATARDWARLGQFWLQDGVWNGERLLPSGWMEWSTTPAPAAPRGEYGAQFWLNAGINGRHRAFPGLPENMYYASGFNGQIVAVFPDQEIVVVRLGFTTDDSWSNTQFLAAVLAALD